MDNPNITIEEYIRLEEEKARNHRKVFNRDTAKYGRIWYDEDVHDLRSIKNEFPAIAFNDSLTSGETLSCEPTVRFLNDEIDFRISFDDFDDEDYTSEKDNDDNEIDIIQSSRDMALLPRDQRHQYLMYKGLQYSDAYIVDFEARLARIYKREVHMVHVFDFGGLPDLMAEGLSARMLMKHRDAQGVSLFTSRAWRQLFDIRGLLVHELILEFFSTFRFGETILDLDKAGALQFQLGGTVGFGAYWADSARQILDKGDLRDSWIGISSVGDFIGIAPSYTSIRDLILRQCHRLIACNIAGRSQAPEKVTMTDLFYLRGMDVGSVNDRLWGLTVISPALPVIDMTELVRVAQDAPVVDEGGQADPTPVQAPPPPPPPPVAARTMPQRMAKLEETYTRFMGH
ncbi:hypothetical protein Tco_0885927 [Tanacetum coccineum]